MESHDFDYINVDTLDSVFNDYELGERPFYSVCRKYNVYPVDIARLLTFARDCLAVCGRFNSDPDAIEGMLEQWETVCDEVEFAIKDIGQRRAIELDAKERLQHSVDLRVKTHDLPFSEGVIHGLELALSSLGDLIEGGFGDES